MHLSKRIALGLLLLPVAEVAAFLLVAWAIGVLPALALMILTSLAGAAVLRRAGRGQIAQARATLRASSGGSPVGAGVLLGLAGILLVLPALFRHRRLVWPWCAIALSLCPYPLFMLILHHAQHVRGFILEP